MKSDFKPDDLAIDPRVLRIIFLVFFGIFATLIITTILREGKWGECTSSKQEFYAFEYEGKIVRTYRSWNHGHWMTVFENGVEKSTIFDYLIWEKLKPGDILIKHKNELNFIIIRDSVRTYYKEMIPDCAQFKE